MGRTKRSLPFIEARDIARSERIESVAQYKQWHDLNKPAGLPRRPDRVYEKEFISWNDFLGNDNPFPIIRRKYRPFNEARAFAQSLNISIRQNWFDMCDAGKKPADIPRRPDLYYRNADEWVSWGNFLGVTVTSRTDTIQNTDTIFFIIFNPQADDNYFKCGVTNGGISSINDFLRKVNGRIICTYYVSQIFNVDDFLTSFNAEPDHEHSGYYYILNLTPILSKLSMQFHRV